MPDFLPGRLADRAANPVSGGLQFSAGEVERLQLKPARAPTPKTGPDWRNLAEVRVRRFTEETGSTALVRVNLRKALARLPSVASDSAACVASSDIGQAGQHLAQSSPAARAVEPVSSVKRRTRGLVPPNAAGLRGGARRSELQIVRLHLRGICKPPANWIGTRVASLQ